MKYTIDTSVYLSFVVDTDTEKVDSATLIWCDYDASVPDNVWPLGGDMNKDNIAYTDEADKIFDIATGFKITSINPRTGVCALARTKQKGTKRQKLPKGV